MGPMRQVTKDIQISAAADAVSTERKGKQRAGTQSPSMYSNDVNQSIATEDDETPAHGDGSPSLSTSSLAGQNMGRTYHSQNFQKTSNTNEPKSPIIGKISSLSDLSQENSYPL